MTKQATRSSRLFSCTFFNRHDERGMIDLIDEAVTEDAGMLLIECLDVGEHLVALDFAAIMAMIDDDDDDTTDGHDVEQLLEGVDGRIARRRDRLVASR